MRILILLVAGASFALSAEETNDTDGDQSRKILGSSVVTSVSVIMDTGNGSKAVYTDAVGKPLPKPSSASELASPINLLNPDRYEFYTFDDNGDLIKRLMSLDEIKGIIATGDSDGYDIDAFTSLGYLPEKRVNDVVNNVQSVLKEEMETHKNAPDIKPMFDTPDVSDSWSMILPAVFGNSGEDIKPEKPITHVTPDTIMIEPNMENAYLTSSSKTNIPVSSTMKPETKVTSPESTLSISTPRSTTTLHISSEKPLVASSPVHTSTTNHITDSTEKTHSPTPIMEAHVKPVINVEIYANSKATEKTTDQQLAGNSEYVEIKPPDTSEDNDDEIRISFEDQSETSKKPLTTPDQSAFSESKSTSPATLITFSPHSTGSTLPTTPLKTKTTTKVNVSYTSLADINLITPKLTTPHTPILTQHTTEIPISTWRPRPIVSELPKTTEPVTFFTKNPYQTTDSPQGLTIKEQHPNLPTLADLLNLNNIETIQTEEPPVSTTPTPEEITSAGITTFYIMNDLRNKESATTDFTTTSSHTKLPEKSEEDLSTLSSDYFGSKNNLLTTQRIDETTQLPLEQSMDTAQKISASELLDQLLSTTNIGEINTELVDTEQAYSNDDERFDLTTQKGSNVSIPEIKTENDSTTEIFIIKIMDSTEAPKTDKTLIDSIEQLLSQAVGNVEEALISINDTEKIQNMLSGSNKRNMTEMQIESATLASTMIDTTFNRNKENEDTTSEITTSEKPDDDSDILSESVGSLLSQIYDYNRPNLTTIEYDEPTEYTTSISNSKTESDEEAHLTTQNYEETSNLNDDDDDFSDNQDTNFEEQDTTPADNATTANYVSLDTTIDNDSDKNFESESHLINITIVSSEDTKEDEPKRAKPAKSDVSLEQMLDEEMKKNMTIIMNEDDIIKLYNEKTATATENANATKNQNEILLTEETMSALYNNTAINEEDNKDEAHHSQDHVNDSSTLSYSLPEEVTETSTEQVSTVTTTDPFVPKKETKRPATVIIIKRTKKPTTEETTITPLVEENNSTDVNIESTTVTNTDLEYTSYVKETTDETEIPSTTTEFTLDEDIETTTENISDLEPTIEVILNENNNPLSDNGHSVTLNKQPVDEEDEDEDEDEDEESNIDNINENSRPQETSNVDVTIPSISPSKHEDEKYSSTSDRPVQNEKPDHVEPETTWTLVPTIASHSEEPLVQNYSPPIQHFPEIIEAPAPIDLIAKPLQGFGLEDSTSRLDTDIYQFAQLCNELAFGFWKTVTTGISSARSVFVSPFGATSLLAMVFLGARGATSGEMNEILRLDDMVTFNPHLIFKNVSESIKEDEPSSGVASSAVIRELFSDRSKGKLLPFYKERAKAFYDGYVEEVSFREIGDVIRRRTNLQVKKYTNGKMAEFLKDSSIVARSPLAGVSVNVFQTDCSLASTDGRDGEIHFVVHPSIRQRRLIPVPAVVYKSGFLAGYEPSVDATAVSLGTKDQIVSTILVIPGQQGIAAPGDGLARLEKRLVESSFKKGAWSRLLRSLIPRPGLEVQIPRFAHRSIINATVTLKRMGLHDLFDVEKADLRGLNGVANELYLSDILQVNSFATCGEKRIGDTHHSEIYPASTTSSRNARHLENYQSENVHYKTDLLEEPRDYQRAFHDPLHDPTYLSLPLAQRPRQARVPETPRLKFDRPFIYFVRHNPTGLILHMGRFHPRLLP